LEQRSDRDVVSGRSALGQLDRNFNRQRTRGQQNVSGLAI
jgi:hypothetical protein